MALKGQESTIGTLAVSGVPIEVLDRKVEAAEIDRWQKVPACKLPQLMVLTSAPQEWAANHVYFTARAFDNALAEVREYKVPRDARIRVLTGRMGDQMREAFRATIDVREILESNPICGNIGSDPEIFVEDGEGKLLPAPLFLPAKKDAVASEPLTYDQYVGIKAGKAYWDGFQAEFETWVFGCMAACLDSTQAGLKVVLRKARKVAPKAKLSIQSVYEIPLDLMKSAPDEAVVLGCKPSKNAYGLHGEPVPEPRAMRYRCTGVHFHEGIGKHPETTYVKLVKAIDAIAGVACVSLFANFDNPVRRRFYGLPGEYRTPQHGLEYRTLSSSVLCHPAIMNLVFDLCRSALKVGAADIQFVWQADEKEIIDTIRGCDVQQARKILTRNKDVFHKILDWGYLIKGGDKNLMRKHAFQAFLNGVESVVKDPTDVAGNWCLDGKWVGHSDGKDKNWSLAYRTLEEGKLIA